MTRPRNSPRGGPLNLTSRILRTYAALYGVLAPVGIVAMLVAYASISGTTDVGQLGVAVGILGMGVIVALVGVPVASARLGLGGGTVIGLFAMILPVLVINVLSESGIATLLIALVWPLGVALVVHGRRAVGAAVLVLGIALSGGWGLWSKSQPDQSDFQKDPLLWALETKDYPLYCPPPSDDVTWEDVQADSVGGVNYRVTQGEHTYAVRLDFDMPYGQLSGLEDVDGEVQTLDDPTGHRVNFLLRNGTWITVDAWVAADLRVADEDWEEPRRVPKAGASFGESLVECSPKELAAHGRPR